MPDGDKVHSKLPWRYQRPYKRLCESKTSSQESVWELMKALLQDIRQKGDNFLKTAQLLAEELENHLVTIRFQGNLALFREDIYKSIRFFGLCYAMDGGYKGWNPYVERHLAIFVNCF
jgi:hypothetical protein